VRIEVGVATGIGPRAVTQAIQWPLLAGIETVTGWCITAKIAYFEKWNEDWVRLHVDIADIGKSKYTQVHCTFPNITADFRPDVLKLQKQFDKLKKLTGIKRVVSFGGWAFSFEASTFNISRSGITDANRVTLTSNITTFGHR
jgi:chitinase